MTSAIIPQNEFAPKRLPATRKGPQSRTIVLRRPAMSFRFNLADRQADGFTQQKARQFAGLFLTVGEVT
jgi:hypothetical protein